MAILTNFKLAILSPLTADTGHNYTKCISSLKCFYWCLVSMQSFMPLSKHAQFAPSFVDSVVLSMMQQFDTSRLLVDLVTTLYMYYCGSCFDYSGVIDELGGPENRYVFLENCIIDKYTMYM